jgi:hypothetical protein
MVASSLQTSADYSVSFKLTLTGTAPRFTNILRIAAVRPDGKYGDRVLGVWLHPSSTKIQVNLDGLEKYNPVLDARYEVKCPDVSKPLRLDQEHSIRIEVQGSRARCFIDGDLDCEVPVERREAARAVAIYASDPFSDPAPALMRELEYRPL